jgi:hypothetical protein
LPLVLARLIPPLPNKHIPPCRHQLADAAIEEQLEVQTAFREQGSKLQSLYEKKQHTEYEIAQR